jgi:hypothetical protein
MLDVHPPHGPTHTWREFFIHIATICIGLLIAIALEQTVEAVHHAHQRRELIADLRNECQENEATFEQNRRVYQGHAAWEAAAAAALMQAGSVQGYATVTLPDPPTTELSHAPSQAVWSVARANGTVALLPENLAEIYDRVDHQGEEFLLANRKVNDLRIEIEGLEVKNGSHIRPASSVHVSTAGRDEIVAGLGREAAANRQAFIWIVFWQAACKAELDNVQNRDAMSSYLDKADKDSRQ